MVLMFYSNQMQAETNVIESAKAAGDVSLSADPTTPFWQNAPRVSIGWDMDGKPVPEDKTEVRSRWTSDSLYLLYICHYQQLYLKPNPDPVNETMQLWKWDVAEAFIGSDFSHINRYKEFEISPQGEWIDLDIDRGNKENTRPWEWQSGFTVKARIDPANKVWYGEMRIPFKSLSAIPPVPGQIFRINLFRAQGPPPDQKLIAWQPTHQSTFHVPEAFGELHLVAK